MTDDSHSLEDNIVSKFLDNLESSDEVSEEISSAISDLSNEGDFGGRDQIANLALEAVGDDED